MALPVAGGVLDSGNKNKSTLFRFNIQQPRSFLQNIVHMRSLARPERRLAQDLHHGAQVAGVVVRLAASDENMQLALLDPLARTRSVHSLPTRLTVPDHRMCLGRQRERNRAVGAWLECFDACEGGKPNGRDRDGGGWLAGVELYHLVRLNRPSVGEHHRHLDQLARTHGRLGGRQGRVAERCVATTEHGCAKIITLWSELIAFVHECFCHRSTEKGGGSLTSVRTRRGRVAAQDSGSALGFKAEAVPAKDSGNC